MKDTPQRTQLDVDWQTWLARWDVQQSGYLPDREARFDAMFDVLDYLMPEQWTALDLASGPAASASGCSRGTPMPAARHRLRSAAARDWARGDGGRRGGCAGIERISRRSTSSIARRRQDRCVLSTTALHWLPGASLWRVFAQLGKVVRPGASSSTGQHGLRQSSADLPADDQSPLEQQQTESFKKKHRGLGALWKAVSRCRAWKALAAEREARFGHRSPRKTAPTTIPTKPCCKMPGSGKLTPSGSIETIAS